MCVVNPGVLGAPVGMPAAKFGALGGPDGMPAENPGEAELPEGLFGEGGGTFGGGVDAIVLILVGKQFPLLDEFWSY
jgi:hypothetical protein